MSTKSSQTRKAPDENIEKPRSPRRFAVEPVETSAKSSRTSKAKDGDLGRSVAPRRFAPQLEVTTHTSNRKGEEQKANKPRRFVPQLEETTHTTTSRRGGRASDGNAKVQSDGRSTATRKFAPEIVESSTRRRKSGDKLPTPKHVDRTDDSPGDYNHVPRHAQLDVDDSSEGSGLPESRFSSANLRKQTPRQTSFQVPHLEPIGSMEESDDSGASYVPSVSSTSSPMSEDPKPANKGDDRFSGYLLALAARAAEKELQEQALAAFPNPDTREPVNHYAADRSSSSGGEESEEERQQVARRHFNRDEPDVSQRRESSAAVWKVVESYKHTERSQGQQEQMKKAPPKVAPFAETLGAAALFGGPVQPDHPKDAIGGVVCEEGELRRMRRAARPPLLGKDIEFPRCPSPKRTRLDPTQRPRPQGEGSETPSRGQSGLWVPACANGAAKSPEEEKTPEEVTWCLKVAEPARPVGLWGGFCAASSRDPSPSAATRLPSGLMTPNYSESGRSSPNASRPTSSDKRTLSGPRLSHPAVAQYQRAPTPRANLSPCAAAVVEGAQAALSRESEIAAEFSDAFVTQVYNYLSLGHPALARKFDTELGRIARVTVTEIRADDDAMHENYYCAAAGGEAALARWDGWAPAKEGGDEAEEGDKEGRQRCARWRALKKYIWEWAKQQPRMEAAAAAGKKEDNWGVRARKGSWAI